MVIVTLLLLPPAIDATSDFPLLLPRHPGARCGRAPDSRYSYPQLSGQVLLQSLDLRVIVIVTRTLPKIRPSSSRVT